MPGPTELDLEFGDGVYTFVLRLPQIIELQRLCGAGIFTIYGRVVRGRYVLQNGVAFGAPHECEAFVGDVYETCRLGLAGGGHGRVNEADADVSPTRARELVEAYLHGRPLKEAWDLAAAILMATVEGIEQKKSPETADEKPAMASSKRRSSSTA